MALSQWSPSAQSASKHTLPSVTAPTEAGYATDSVLPETIAGATPGSQLKILPMDSPGNLQAVELCCNCTDLSILPAQNVFRGPEFSLAPVCNTFRQPAEGQTLGISPINGAIYFPDHCASSSPRSQGLHTPPSTLCLLPPAPPSELPEELMGGMYVLRGSIGEGSFAKVHMATHVLSATPVAVKSPGRRLSLTDHEQMVKKKKLQDRDLKNMRREAVVWALTSHPNIARLYQVIENEHWFCFVAELCPSGELFDRIIVSKRLSEGEAREYLRQILAAVSHCHALGFAHRDLKPENILLDKNLNLKLVDFGLAGVFAAPALIACEKANISSASSPGRDQKGKTGWGLSGQGLRGGPGRSSRDSLLATRCGSEYYAAPELIAGELYDGVAADIWSIGVLLYTMVCGSLPFFHENTQLLYDQIFEGEYTIPRFLSLECENVINACLQLDPVSRASIASLLTMPWLQHQDLAVAHPSALSAAALEEGPVDLETAELQGLAATTASSSFHCALGTAQGRTDLPGNCEVLDALCDHHRLTPSQLEKALQLGVCGPMLAEYTLLLQARARLGCMPLLLQTSSCTQHSQHDQNMNSCALSRSCASSVCSDFSSVQSSTPKSTPSAGPEQLGQVDQLEALQKEFANLNAEISSQRLSRGIGSLNDISCNLSMERMINAPGPPDAIPLLICNSRMHHTDPASEESQYAAVPPRLSAQQQSGFDHGINMPVSDAPLTPLEARPPPSVTGRRRRAISDAASRMLRIPGSALASLRRLFSRTASHDAAGPRSVRGVFGTGTTSSLPPADVCSRLLFAFEGRPGAQVELSGFSARVTYCIPGKLHQLKIDVEVCVVAGTALTGIRFKRLRGDAWSYQQECSAVIELLQL